MKEFNVVPHGAGKNFLGALQVYITGDIKRQELIDRIAGDNLFDNDYKPVHFLDRYYPEPKRNRLILQCHVITENMIYNRITRERANQDISMVALNNERYQGSFCLGYTVPPIKSYNTICLLDNPIQRIWLDDLAMYKKENAEPDPVRQELARKLFDWEQQNIPNCETIKWTLVTLVSF